MKGTSQAAGSDTYCLMCRECIRTDQPQSQVCGGYTHVVCPCDENPEGYEFCILCDYPIKSDEIVERSRTAVRHSSCAAVMLKLSGGIR